MLTTPIGRLRLIALIEGASFIVLLFVAMPMKYLAGIEAAVKVVGMAHGLLFVAFCLALLLAIPTLRYDLKHCAVVFGASLVPFAPFVIDGWLRRLDSGLSPENSLERVNLERENKSVRRGVERPVAPTKAETALLEPFDGLTLERIVVPKGRADCRAAVAEILAAGVAGFDTEAKPTFKVGEKSRGPHVVQFALRERAFVFQLHRSGSEEAVAELLQSDRVLKVGFGLKNDHGQIRARFGIVPQGIVDLERTFRKMGYAGQIGVRAAVGVTLQRSFSKSKKTTTSNWAAERLTSKQLAYAANDAFAALCVMEALGLGEKSEGLKVEGSKV